MDFPYIWAVGLGEMRSSSPYLWDRQGGGDVAISRFWGALLEKRYETCQNMEEIWRNNEGIREYMLPYTWAVGLTRIPSLPAGGGRARVCKFWVWRYPGEKTWNMSMRTAKSPLIQCLSPMKMRRAANIYALKQTPIHFSEVQFYMEWSCWLRNAEERRTTENLLSLMTSLSYISAIIASRNTGTMPGFFLKSHDAMAYLTMWASLEVAESI